MTTGFHAMVTKKEISSEHLCGSVPLRLPIYVHARISCHLLFCSLFAEKVLQYMKPRAIILGGDLVDAKTLQMQGRQYRQEWEVLIFNTCTAR